jgi:hypothetical protein
MPFLCTLFQVFSPTYNVVSPLRWFSVSRVLAFSLPSWGYVQWVPKLTSLLWDGMVEKSELICEELLDTCYHRVNPLLKEEITMDDPKKLPVLADLARHFDLTTTIQWVEQHFYPEKEKK